MSMIPKYPFQLVIHWADGQRQVKTFETLATALAAGEGLRPALVRHWELSIILQSRTMEQHAGNNHHHPKSPVVVINKNG